MDPPRMDLRQIVTDPANDKYEAPNKNPFERLIDQTGRISLYNAVSIFIPIGFAYTGTRFLMSGQDDPGSYVIAGLLYLGAVGSAVSGYVTRGVGSK